ncbi:bifunctional glycosyltransferase family 2/GtrA family protein [Anaerococcus sp. AGMB00486]|uniref:Bifunctional glycosyltransferase family 2/GtrA family protein n=1 Tax=Anaerococcus faecalis TaxID=2742993 RepID=A0ABX2N8V8_9FIRM|nr:glycosyltransferase [Anaerococcus faecalis]NVF10994.1 bifunctional glycosyltransferase family 2/GtrA family protein [Anaerococcus faecalis]
MKDIIILIPALNPPKEILFNYINDLRKKGFERILIVDDGCSKDYEKFFDDLKCKGIEIFKHYKNFGKGRALKNSFNYILNNYNDFSYVITADSDGQHNVSDIENIANILRLSKENKLYLGSRNFNKDNVPFKSAFGNKITSFVYKIMFGDKIYDTQTGLRAISKKHLEDFLDLEGERFEYEINMLIYSSKNDIEIEEIPIKTVYFDNNSETHFNPIKDSFKIYLVMFKTFFKFILSSISSWIVDISSYTLLVKILKNMFTSFSPIIWISTIVARIISGLFNYTVNKNLVFNDDVNHKNVFLKYIFLWLSQLILSAFLVDKIYYMINLDSSIIKIGVDSLIFLVSFKIQDKYIFN